MDSSPEVPPTHIEDKILVQKVHPQAEFPTKERPCHVGWEVTLISRTENRAEDETGEINDFGTGIHVTPPEGYFLEMIASRSLHRHGYMLPGPVIIEPGARGELMVPLFKFRESDDISLPFGAVRLLTRPTVYAHISNIKGSQRTQNYQMGNSYTPPGPYVQGNPTQAGYSGDMNGYKQQVETYPPGTRRPQAAPQIGNHMF